jgi:transposase
MIPQKSHQRFATLDRGWELPPQMNQASVIYGCHGRWHKSTKSPILMAQAHRHYLRLRLDGNRKPLLPNLSLSPSCKQGKSTAGEAGTDLSDHRSSPAEFIQCPWCKQGGHGWSGHGKVVEAKHGAKSLAGDSLEGPFLTLLRLNTCQHQRGRMRWTLLRPQFFCSQLYPMEQGPPVGSSRHSMFDGCLWNRWKAPPFPGAWDKS